MSQRPYGMLVLQLTALPARLQCWPCPPIFPHHFISLFFGYGLLGSVSAPTHFIHADSQGCRGGLWTREGQGICWEGSASNCYAILGLVCFMGKRPRSDLWGLFVGLQYYGSGGVLCRLWWRFSPWLASSGSFPFCPFTHFTGLNISRLEQHHKTDQENSADAKSFSGIGLGSVTFPSPLEMSEPDSFIYVFT